MSDAFQHAALIIAGHGSTLNPDSSAPTHQHADVIRRCCLFAEVVCSFWKEEPSYREAPYQVRSRQVYVVPNFISEGYFCQQVLPREFRLDGPITERDGRIYYYCDPVGIHPSMTRLLLKRADEVASGVPRDQIGLIIVGHGTTLNENSRQAIVQQVELIRNGGYGFAEVLDAYMEEPPLVAKWCELSTAPHVVVVPFFIADGLHSYQDIPVLLGIEAEPTAARSQQEVFRHNPHDLQGRKLYYSSAIGTEDLMVEVILDQVRDFNTKHGITPLSESDELPILPAPFVQFGESGVRMGELHVQRDADGGWSLRHVADVGLVDEKALARYDMPEEAREIGLYDAQGEFRPIKTAPSLKRGWVMNLVSDEDLHLALDFFYPAALGLWEHWQAGTLQPVPLRETLGRQTGMYRYTNTITDDQAQQLAAERSAKSLCRVMWPLAEGVPLTLLHPDNQPLSTPMEAAAVTAEIPLLSVEADTHVVGTAREIARNNFTAQSKA